MQILGRGPVGDDFSVSSSWMNYSPCYCHPCLFAASEPNLPRKVHKVTGYHHPFLFLFSVEGDQEATMGKTSELSYCGAGVGWRPVISTLHPGRYFKPWGNSNSHRNVFDGGQLCLKWTSTKRIFNYQGYFQCENIVLFIVSSLIQISCALHLSSGSLTHRKMIFHLYLRTVQTTFWEL